ncbi:MAG: 50S ribosomal protein L6 [Spirochaetia bacterium]|nr:50S ribosomal protein L6 [Spirochaetia bacterium]
MSRIGNQIIEIPAGVKVDVKTDHVSVNGPKGTLNTPIHAGIQVTVENNAIKVSRTSEEKNVKSSHGLIRSLLKNSVMGITTGFTRNLELHGVGYRAQKKGETLVMNLGFSHEIILNIPKDVVVQCTEPTKILVTGIDKQRVGQMASDIRSQKPPEPYKGKGIRYAGEKVRRKAGKAGKK